VRWTQASHEDQQRRSNLSAFPGRYFNWYRGYDQGPWMKNSPTKTACLMTLGLMLLPSPTPASAQPSNAAELCTPDVMRLCNEFVPDVDRITACMQKKRGQLSPAPYLSQSGSGASIEVHVEKRLLRSPCSRKKRPRAFGHGVQSELPRSRRAD